jgi:hypothetical protein
MSEKIKTVCRRGFPGNFIYRISKQSSVNYCLLMPFHQSTIVDTFLFYFSLPVLPRSPISSFSSLFVTGQATH